MNHETQLARPTPLPAPQEEVWGQLSTADNNPQQTPLRKAHKILRGRYWLAIPLAIICAGLGAWLAYRSQQPLYESAGLVIFNPVQRSYLDSAQILPGHGQYVEVQASMISTQRAIETALASPEWKQIRPGLTRDQMARFAKNLKVQRAGAVIQVSYLDPDPAAAKVGAQEIIRSYLRTYVTRGTAVNLNQSDFQDPELIDMIAQNQSRLIPIQRELTQNREQLQRIRDQLLSRYRYGSESLDSLHDHIWNSLVRARAELAQANARVREAERALGLEPGELPEERPLAIEEIAMFDRNMFELLRQQRQQERRLEVILQDLGESHRTVRNAQLELAQTQQDIEAYAEEVRQRPVHPGGNAVVVPGMLQQYREQAQMLAGQVRELEQELYRDGGGGLAADIAAVRRLRSGIDRNERAELEINQRLERLQAQQQMADRIRVTWPDAPFSPAVDRRRQAAAAGLVGGAALPVALLLLIGFIDRRFRYSDEAGTDVPGVTLLGILPNLPDRLRDPEQAAIAAHCVHQIRTMLQINGGGRHQVFGITSSSPGDGKTSLTLALGLSFAASGSRVLLIDADVVGAGLTTRLDMQGPDGVLEAMANQSLLEYVRTTDVADVMVLPVGAAHAHHASAISPAAVERLFDEAKKHFDIIVVDTGPILGSIEAGPICASADAVVLTVSRGQQRPLVERSLQRLTTIAAPLAGVVFNRAERQDLEQSVSRLSVRASVPANGRTHGKKVHRKGKSVENGSNSDGNEAFGPVARAVASNVRSSDEHDHR
jgi:polysaccharide biosynthesis transport protein